MVNNSYVLGVDIGGTNVRIGLVDEGNNLYNYKKVPQKTVLKEPDTVKSLAVYLTDYIKDAGKENIIALVVGIPGAMNRDRSAVLNAPNINGFNGRRLKSELEEYFDFSVFLERDVTTLFYYDLFSHNIPHKDIIIGCYVGTGIGNVISVDGKPLLGNDGAACELGHIPVWDKTDICNCGNEGCIETYVGGKHLVELNEKYFPDTDISDLFVKHSESPIIEKYIEHLSLPIATEINILNPAVIILGGGVLAMDNFPKKLLEKEIYKHSRKPFPAENLNIIYSDNGGENGIYGSNIFARTMLKNKI